MAGESEISPRRVSPHAAKLLRTAQTEMDFANESSQIPDPDNLVEELCEKLRDSARALIDAALDNSEQSPACLALLRERQADLEERVSFLKRAPLPVPPGRVEETSEMISEVVALLCAHALLYLDADEIEKAQKIAQGLERLRLDLTAGKPVSAVAIRGGVHYAVELIRGEN